MKKILGVVLLLSLYAIECFTQTIPFGSPQITNYFSDDYNAGDQNWCITQDKRGVIYFVNTGGLVEFDGIDWHLIHLPGDLAWRVIADNNNKIYVSGSGEIGYLKSNSQGILEYQSLLSKIPKDHRDLRDIWGLYYYDDALVFISLNKIYILKNDSIQVVQAQDKLAELGVFNDTLFVEVKNKGVHFFKDNQLAQVDKSYKDFYFRKIVNWTDKTGLLVSRTNGLYLLENNKILPWATELNKYYPNLSVYHCVAIENKYVAIATVKNGIIIINNKGQIIQHISTNNGLPSNTIYHLYLDNKKRLWAGHNDGLSCIEIFSPYFHFTSQNNLKGDVLASAVFNNKLYLGGEPNLYFIQWPPVNSNVNVLQLSRIEINTGQIYLLKEYVDELFCVHQRGVTVIDKNNNTTLININEPCLGITSNIRNKDLVFTCTNSSGYVLYKAEGKWKYKQAFKGHKSFEKSIGFDYNNYLWTYSRNEGLVKLKLTSKFDSIVSKEVYTHIGNAKIGFNSELYIVNQQVYLLLENKVYGYNSFNNNFLEVQFVFDGKIIRMFDWKEQESVWALTTRGIMKFVMKNGGNYYPDTTSGPNLKGFSKIDHISSLGDDLIIGHSKGVSYYQSKYSQNTEYKIDARIRKVKLINNDSIIFGGSFPENSAELLKQEQGNRIKDISYENNSVRFLFGTWTPQVNAEVKYQFKLKNFDANWSNWTTETSKDYTNLGSGEYTFYVRTSSSKNDESCFAKYTFIILPPWYLTKYAFVVYFIFLLTTVLIIRKFIKKRYQQKFEKVEKDIKIDLFTNISHEIKTPITLILSPLEEIISKGKDEENSALHMLMYRNAKKLKHLVNLLLDLRKVESGNMKLQVKKDDIIQFVEDVYLTFNHIAKQNKIDYRLDTSYEARDLWFDKQKLEIILTNLLSNAFKYTSHKGVISISIADKKNWQTSSSHGEFAKEPPMVKIGQLKTEEYIEIAIEDTGLGISEEKIKSIFNKFYSEDKKNYINAKNTGIGLAFTDKLIQLHRAELLVWSKPELGSKFMVRLSAENNFYTKDEIDDREEELIVKEPVIELKKEADSQNNNGSENENIAHTILVVDDEEDMRAYLQSLFLQEYKVLEASNGEIALKIIKQELPDLVISDIKMPEMNGIELCRKVKGDAFTAHIPFILLTGSGNEEVQFESFESGANQYISKPFNPNLLKVRVQKLIENSLNVKQQVNTEKFSDITSLVKDLPENEHLLNQTIEVINENLSDPEFNINKLAAALNLSRTILYRKFKEYTEITPNEYIQIMRLKKSKSLLLRKDLTISEVAYLVGFNDAKYFSTSFKKQFNQTPKEYRLSNQENLEIA